MTDVASIARDAAHAGGSLVRASVDAVTGRRSKSTATDFVSDVDIAAGVAIVRTILEREPGSSVIVEEPEVYSALGISPGTLDDERVWIVDPLDGTTSFLHAYPCYSVSVALVENGRPVAGAVYNAALDEMNWAADGTGAFLGDRPLTCSSAASVSEALLVTGFPYDRGEPLERQLNVLAAFLRTPVHGIRRDGSAAIDCCHVASGRADGFWEYALMPWDMAAGVVICREAGARVTGIDGEEWGVHSTGIIVANEALHAQMLDVIRAAAS